MMRSVLFFIGVITFQLSNAQTYTDQKLSLGIGTAFNYYRDYETGVGAGLRLSYEGKIHEFAQGLLGHVELGGSIAYSATDANSNLLGFKTRFSWNNVLIAPRLNYVLPLSSDFNIYLGTHLGLRIVNFKEEVFSLGNSTVVRNKSYYRFHSGAYIGGDYSLNKNFKIFGETGYDFLWFTLGLKLNIPN